jgi:uncharacterized protein YbjT (DUF2867 family)
MNVFVAGATGHLGKHTVSFLLKQNHVLQCLCRPGSEAKLEPVASKVKLITGDALTPGPLVRQITPGSVFIHLVGGLARTNEEFWRLNFETAKNMADLALATDCPHFILVSAVGQIPFISSEYIKSKLAAENYLKETDLNWTIFKPSGMMNWNSFFAFINFGLTAAAFLSRQKDKWAKRKLLPVETVAEAIALVVGKEKFWQQTVYVPDIVSLTGE